MEPSWLKSTEMIASLCPLRVCTRLPEGWSQTFTTFSSPPVAMRSPLRLNRATVCGTGEGRSASTRRQSRVRHNPTQSTHMHTCSSLSVWNTFRGSMLVIGNKQRKFQSESENDFASHVLPKQRCCTERNPHSS